MITRQADQMRHLIEDYLDAQTLEDGQLYLERVPYSLNRIATEVLEELRDSSSAKGIRLDVMLEPSLPLSELDVSRITQVAINLVGNAIKFSSRDSLVLVRTRVARQAMLSGKWANPMAQSRTATSKAICAINIRSLQFWRLRTAARISVR